MFNSLMVQIAENKVLNLRAMKKSLIANRVKLLDHNINDNLEGNILNLNVNLRKKKIYAIVEGEEVYIKLITIPKVNFNKIDSLVRNELLFSFKDINSILFTYSILKESESSIDVIVFCLNSDKVDVLRKNIEDFSQIKGIYLIQFCIINFMKKVIKEKNFDLIFGTKQSIYLMTIRDNMLLGNKVLKNIETRTEFRDQISDCILASSMNYGDANTYFVNIKDKSWIKDYLEDKTFVDLGVYNEKEIMNNITIKNK